MLKRNKTSETRDIRQEIRLQIWLWRVDTDQLKDSWENEGLGCRAGLGTHFGLGIGSIVFDLVCEL